MKLTELLNSLKIKHEDVKDLDFTKITKDSRKCNGNTIYFNINKKYLTSAIKNNAKIIITDDDYFNNKLIVIKVNKLFDIYVKALKFLYLNYSLRLCEQLPCPLFCAHSTRDTDVPYEEFLELQKKYRPTTFIASTDVHDFDRLTDTKAAQDLLEATVKFLDSKIL